MSKTWVSPIPATRPDPPTHPTLGASTSRYIYQDGNEDASFAVLRFDLPEGKTFRPLTLWRDDSSQLSWDWQFPPEPHSLWGLHRLIAMPYALVLVTEGEKAAKVAQLRFPELVVVTSPGGSSSGHVLKADWSVLKGRSVGIWPDADPPGTKFASTVMECLDGIASSVRLVDIPDEFKRWVKPGKDNPGGWDLADEPPIEWINSRLLDLIKALYESDEPDPEKNPIQPSDIQAASANASTTQVQADGVPPDAKVVPDSAPIRGQEQEQPSSAFIEVNVADWLNTTPPPLQWIVEGLLPRPYAGIFASPGGLGKSGLLLDTGVALATGGKMLGRSLSEGVPAGVVFVSMEDGQDEVHRRTAALLERHRAQGSWGPEQESAYLAHFKPLFPNWRYGLIELAKQWEWIASKANSIPGGCGLIVLDTFSILNPRGDENGTTGTSAMLTACAALEDATGATVVALHHTGKGYGVTTDVPLEKRMHAEAARGASAITFRSRFVLTAVPLTPSEAGRLGLDRMKALLGGYVAFGLTKFNAGPTGSWMLLERQGQFLVPVPDGMNMILSLVNTVTEEGTRKDSKVITELFLAGSIKALDRRAVALRVWPNSASHETAVNQLNKMIGKLRLQGLINDLGLTEQGRAVALALLPDPADVWSSPDGSANPDEGEKADPIPGTSPE